MSEKLLMHKDIKVAKILQNGSILEIIEVYNKDHLPVGVYNDINSLMDHLVNAWSNDRVIPDDRQNLDAINQKLGATVTDAYAKSLGVSLTDCYWFKEENSKLCWEDVNFYDNGFEEKHFSPEYNFFHPDLTTNGTLEKTWKYIDGVPYLFKRENSNVLTVNEVVVSEIAGRLGINCTPYLICKTTNGPWCVCPDIIKDNSTEMISALQISHTDINNTKYCLNFLNKNFKDEFMNMLFLHCLVHNTDGHDKNIALLRNADTLEYMGFSPLYDNGTSLGSYMLNSDGTINENVKKSNKMKDFFSNRNEILNYMGKDILRFSLSSYEELTDIVKKHYESNNIPEHIFTIACDELKDGYDSIIKKQKEIMWQIEVNTEWER